MTTTQNPSVQAQEPGGSTECDLLEMIKRARACVGDGLEDQEFTFYMQQRHLPPQCGFSFVCFHDGFATFSVPPQKEDRWRSCNCRIVHEKELIAKQFAAKHHLMLSEPPDSSRRFTAAAGAAMTHHLHFSNRKETIIVAQPEFLKIRLYSSETHMVMPHSPELLCELSALYQ